MGKRVNKEEKIMDALVSISRLPEHFQAIIFQAIDQTRTSEELRAFVAAKL